LQISQSVNRQKSAKTVSWVLQKNINQIFCH